MFSTIHVIGIGRKSGKTKLIQALVKELTQRQYRVSTIKHIFEGTFDTIHKDTWIHFQAGAQPVIAVSPKELVIIKENSNSFLENALKEIPRQVDVVLIEGFKESENPKIIAARSFHEVEELIQTTTEVVAISGPISSIKRNTGSFKGIPILDFNELVSFLERMIRN